MNSVGTRMNLSAGKASKAISLKAGPELQKACDALAPINVGEVKETSGYNLEVETILHCCPQAYIAGSEVIEVSAFPKVIA